MKIEKKALESALRKVKPFVGKSLPEIQKVLVDAENQQLVATDLTTWFFTPLEIKEYERTVTAPVVFPDDGLKTEMGGLKRPQLVALAEYAGVPAKGKMDDIIADIMTESQKSAEADENRADTFTVTESFCVLPDKLLKIVSSMELTGSDMVTMTPESRMAEAGLFGDGGEIATLTIGDNFQRIAVTDAKNFPEWFDVENDVPVISLEGNVLKTVAKICVEDDNRLFKEHVCFDKASGYIAATDGNRLHVVTAAVQESVLLNFKAVTRMASIAKDKPLEISYSAGQRYAVMKAGKDRTMTRVDTDVAFPQFTDIITGNANMVTVNREKFTRLFKQASLVSDEDYTAVRLTFNGGIEARLENPGKGTFTNESVEMVGTIDPKVDMNVNPKFMMEALNCLTGETVEVRLSSADVPLIVGADAFKAAIMPMRA